MYSIKRVNGRKQPSLHSHPLSVRSRRGWEEQFQGMLIAAYGFVTGASVQPESINTGIILCALILPLIFGILGLLIFGTQYTLDQKAVIEMDAKINRNN